MKRSRGSGPRRETGAPGASSSGRVFPRPSRCVALTALALPAAPWGCTPFADPEDRLGADAGGISVAQARNDVDPWWCLGQSEAAVPGTRERSAANTQFALRMPLHDQFTQQPPAPGLEGRLCYGTDLGCTSPVANWTAVPADGRLTALVPFGYSGYAEVRGAGYINSLFVVDAPTSRDTETYSHALLTVEGLNAIAQVLMTEVVQPGFGIVVATAIDCNGANVAGARITLSSTGTPFVIVGGVPVAGRNETAADGTIAFTSVPPGPTIVSITLPSGRLVKEQAVDVRGGWYSGSFVRPNAYSTEELCGIDGARVVPGRTADVGRFRPCTPRN